MTKRTVIAVGSASRLLCYITVINETGEYSALIAASARGISCETPIHGLLGEVFKRNCSCATGTTSSVGLNGAAAAQAAGKVHCRDPTVVLVLLPGR